MLCLTRSSCISYAGQQLPPSKLATCPGGTEGTRIHHTEGTLREGTVAHALHHGAMACPIKQKGAHGTIFIFPSATGLRFFSPAQPHVVESVWSALVAMNTPLQNVRMPSSGMAWQAQYERMSKGTWSRQMAFCSVSTGSLRDAACPQATQIDTNAQAAENPIMGLKAVLKQRKHKLCTPYNQRAWAEQLSGLGLEGKYPRLIQGLIEGFDLGIPPIKCTYAPLNHPSLRALANVLSKIIDDEFGAGHYIGPFTQKQLEQAIGPFQSSPLSLVPKVLKPDVYCAVHNFSHLHDPSPDAASINSHIDCDVFPCTWGTFSTVALLIARLPPSLQASIRDVAEAYRTIPALPSQWPGLIICLQTNDQFAVNMCNNFGLTLASRADGMVSDAGVDVFQGQGMGPLTKWVDDHIFFRVPRTHLHSYNAQRTMWHNEIFNK